MAEIRTIAHLLVPAIMAVLSGCGQGREVNLHDTMAKTVAPKAQVLWDITNAALDDEGKFSTAKLTNADWTRLAATAKDLGSAARDISAARRIVVAAPGVRLQDEGNPGAWGASQVQHAIDGSPQDLRQHADQLASTADKFEAAVGKRDGATLGELAASLDQVCESCHVQFWYPNE